MRNAIQMTGDTLGSEKIAIKNVTASAFVKGGTYALDIPQADGDTTDERGGSFNAVVVAAGNIGGILVVAESAIPAGEEGFGVVKGLTKALVDGTTDVAKGDRLKATAASPNLSKAAATAGSVDIGVGLAFGAQAADSAVLTTVYFDGFSFNKVVNGATS